MDLSSVQINKKNYCIRRKIETIHPIDLFYQLDTTEVFPKVYWNHKDDDIEHVAFGKLLEFDHLPKIETIETLKGAPIDPELFGGISFSKAHSNYSHFSSFPSNYFMLPEFVIKKQQDKYTLHTYSLSEDTLFPKLKIQDPHSLTDELPKIIQREDNPEKETWDAHIAKILHLFKNSEIKKTVLARQTHLTLEKKLNPYLLLQFLKDTQNNCSTFSFELKPGTSFLGATPECLFTRWGQNISTEAIAGTSLEGQKNLLESQKDFAEHAYVTDYLANKLELLCEHVKQNASKEISTGYLKHIYSHYEGLLKEKISDENILKTLHPTPAVCGTPCDLASKLIDQLETFDRGWYAAPVGKISEHHSQFLVAIRSAVVSLNHLFLFSGCGIVKGSDSQKEWEELETKIAPYLQFTSRHVCT